VTGWLAFLINETNDIKGLKKKNGKNGFRARKKKGLFF